MFWDRFWCHFGLPNGTRGGPLSCANRPWGGPRRSWNRLGSALFSSCGSGSLFCPSWARLGVVLGCFWLRFGPSWSLLASFWGSPVGIFERFNFFLVIFFAFVVAGLAQSVSDNRHYFLSTHLLINSLPINSLTLSSNSSLQSYSNSSTLIQSTCSSIVLWLSSSMVFVLFPSTPQPSPLL